MKKYIGYIIKINEEIIEVAIPALKKEICVFKEAGDEQLVLGAACTIIQTTNNNYEIKRKE